MGKQLLSIVIEKLNKSKSAHPPSEFKPVISTVTATLFSKPNLRGQMHSDFDSDSVTEEEMAEMKKNVHG
jgi:hypothetical protein